MCLHNTVKCVCGQSEAYLFYRDNILPEETVIEIFCPFCSPTVKVDPNSMIKDVDWIIHYDMDIARFFLKNKGINLEPTPEFLFYEDYCSWYGLSPTDVKDTAELVKELEYLKKASMEMYFYTFKKRRLERIERLKKYGYLKALRA